MLIAASATTLAAAGSWAALSSPLLRLDSVVVHGVSNDSTSRLTVQQVLVAADAPLGRSLLRVQPGQVREHVAALPAIARVQVRRLWPHRLEIDVVERTPVAAVATATGAVTMVDGSGVPFATVPTAPADLHLLDLRLGAPVSVGAPGNAPGDTDAGAALAVWRSLPSPLRAQVQWISATTPDAVSFGLSQNATVVWGSAGQTAAKITALTVLLQHRAKTYDVSTPSFAVTSG